MQKTVGTVVKTTDSIDPIAVLTVLPLRRYDSLTCLKEIKKYLEANCDSNCQQAFQQVSACRGLACRGLATTLIVALWQKLLVRCPACLISVL